MPSNRTYFKFLKGFSILIILLFIPKACLEFRISDQEALKDFSDRSIKPLFGNKMVEGRNIHYAYTNQNKQALTIFIHGSPGSWNAFDDYFESVALLAYTDILAIDRPGFGHSDFGNAEPSLELQAKLLNAVIQEFSQETKILVGHSLGGPVTARLTMDYPFTYSGLILVAASIDPELEKEEWYRGIIQTKIGEFFTPTEFKVSNDEIISLKKELEIMLPMWEKIKIRCVVIQGTKDFLVPKENVDFARRMLADSLLDVRMLEGENHFIPWSNIGVITEAIYQMVEPQ